MLLSLLPTFHYFGPTVSNVEIIESEPPFWQNGITLHRRQQSWVFVSPKTDLCLNSGVSTRISQRLSLFPFFKISGSVFLMFAFVT